MKWLSFRLMLTTKSQAMQKAITQGLESEDVKGFDINAFTKRMLKESHTFTEIQHIFKEKR